MTKDNVPRGDLRGCTDRGGKRWRMGRWRGRSGEKGIEAVDGGGGMERKGKIRCYTRKKKKKNRAGWTGFEDLLNDHYRSSTQCCVVERK